MILKSTGQEVYQTGPIFTNAHGNKMIPIVRPFLFGEGMRTRMRGEVMNVRKSSVKGTVLGANHFKTPEVDDEQS